MKQKIFWLCALRESVKVLIVLDGLLILCLPEACAEIGKPLLALLLMIVCGMLIRHLWSIACCIDSRVLCLRKQLAQQKQQERELYMRAARRRQCWQRYFAGQEI